MPPPGHLHFQNWPSRAALLPARNVYAFKRAQHVPIRMHHADDLGGNRVNLKIALIAASSIAVVGLAFGQAGVKGGPPPGGGKGPQMGGPGGGQRHMPTPEERLKRMTDMLKLTPDQQKKIKPILEDSSKKSKTIFDDQKMTRDQKMA